MNTLIFIAGMGAGSFVTVLVSMWLVGRVNKNSTDRQAKFNQVTEELLRERNELDRQRNEIMRNQYSTLSSIDLNLGNRP